MTMTIYQSRPDTRYLVSLVAALGVGLGVVGCSTHPTTPTGASAAGTISSASAQGLVDVEQVWASHPMPDCSRVVIGNATASPGLVLPDDASVARQLTGVRSPGSGEWVRSKLGWVTQELAATRADIIDANSPDDKSMLDGFTRYVEHVKSELIAGHDITDSIDKTYPEGCS